MFFMICVVSLLEELIIEVVFMLVCVWNLCISLFMVNWILVVVVIVRVGWGVFEGFVVLELEVFVDGVL